MANDIDDGLPMAYADAGLLERVVANLVDNAHRHSPAGSRVEVRGRASDGSVQIAVVDHGTGVSDGDWDKMFVPFQRLHDRSTASASGSAWPSPGVSPTRWAARWPRRTARGAGSR